MKPILFALLILSFFACKNASEQAQEDVVNKPSLTLLWKTDSLFTGSESCLYDSGNGRIFVTNGNTQPTEKDNDGFISILSADGTVQQLKWITGGLHAPKGMALLNGKLYTADVEEFRVIDIATATIEKSIQVDGAIMLNDVATNGENIYVSDNRTGTIYAFDKQGAYKVIANNTPNVNGLECYNGHLYALDKEGLKKFSKDGLYTQEIINSEVTGGDGLVIINDTTFIASRWAGEVFFIKGKEVTTLLDTREQKSNTADIGFIKDKNVVLIPTFLKNEVAAYELSY